jgi:hypothetical protein
MFTYLFSIKISLLFHLLFLNVTCSCPYSYNIMLITTYMCRPNTQCITLIVQSYIKIGKSRVEKYRNPHGYLFTSIYALHPAKLSCRFRCSPTPSPSLTKKIGTKTRFFFGHEKSLFFSQFIKTSCWKLQGMLLILCIFQVNFFSVKRRQNETSP